MALQQFCGTCVSRKLNGRSRSNDVEPCKSCGPGQTNWEPDPKLQKQADEARR